MTRARAFTIVEMAVAVTIASLMVLALLTVVREPQLGVHRARQVEVLASYDRRARELATRTGIPCRIEYDVSDSEVRVYSGMSGDVLLMEPLRLAYGVKINGISIDERAMIRRGRVEIAIDRWGGSQTYGLEIRWPGVAPQQFLVAGVTGRFEEIRERGGIRRVLGELQALRNDAD